MAEVRIMNKNLNDYFRKSTLRLAWTTILSMPGAQVRHMRKPGTPVVVSYMTPQDIIDKFEYRFKHNDPKMLQLHGHKWNYMLKRAQELNREE